MTRLPPGTLMARAAFGLAVECLAELRHRGGGVAGPRVAGSRAAVLVGAGDNGGDALYAAALLAQRGVRVAVVPLDPARMHRGGLRACTAAGAVRVVPPEAAGPLVRGADLVLDGIVGIGGTGGLRPGAASLAEAAAEASRAGGVTIAVDLPSGIEPDTGVVAGAAVLADVTVTFGCLKPGVLVGAGRRHAGEVRLVDVGIGDDLAHGPGPVLAALTDGDLPGLLPVPAATDTKYSRGVLGVLAGSGRYPGAAVLAVGAALATGVGMVRAVSVPEVTAAVVGRWPSAVVTPIAPDAEGSVSGAEGVVRAGRVQAWLVGPGLGTSAGARAALLAVLDSDVPVVVDADGLTLLAREGEAAWERLAARAAPTVLTPHDGEFVRLFGSGALDGGDRVAAVRRAAARACATVLLKGDATLVADGGTGGLGGARGAAGAGADPVLVNRTGVGWLASAGSGDVLAGAMGALLATGLPPAAAAAVAAHLHGRAAATVGGGSSADLVPAIAGVLGGMRA